MSQNRLSMPIVLLLICFSSLTSQAEEGSGLTGLYYPTPDFNGTPINRLDSTVNFDWSGTGTGIPTMPKEQYSVLWKGQLQTSFSETHTLSVTSDDGVLLIINGTVLINNWTDHAVTENTASIDLEAGKKYDIALRYYQNKGKAVVRLQWASNSLPKQVIPSGNLFPFKKLENKLAILSEQESRTSPAWLEGTVSEAATNIKVRTLGGTNINIVRESAGRWYGSTNNQKSPLGISLSAYVPTIILAESFEEKSSETLLSSIKWTVTNLANLPYGLEEVTIRAGDKLLFSAWKRGGRIVEIDTNYNGTSFTPVLSGTANKRFAVPFATPGRYEIRAKCDSIEVGRLKITVAGIDFLGATADQIGYQRVKGIKLLPTSEIEPKLSFTSNDPDRLMVSPFQKVGDQYQVKIMPLSMGNRMFQIRIGGEYGPLLAQQKIDVFSIASTAQKTINLIGYLPDGTQITQASLVMSPLVPDLTVDMRTFVSGVTFDDSTTRKRINTNDFTKDGQDGSFVYKLLRLPLGHARLCHAFVVYQNGVRVSK